MGEPRHQAGTDRHLSRAFVCCSLGAAEEDRKESRSRVSQRHIRRPRQGTYCRHLRREQTENWQAEGWIPDMRIESGAKTDEPIRTRGWTYWHHLFNPRQLLTGSLIKRHSSAKGIYAFTQAISVNSRLSRWNALSGVGKLLEHSIIKRSTPFSIMAVEAFAFSTQLSSRPIWRFRCPPP